MLAYILIFSTAFFGVLLELKNRSSGKSVFWGYLLILVLFAGFRGDVDSDFGAYRDIFSTIYPIGTNGWIDTVFLAPHVEFGFGFLCAFSKMFSSNVTFLMLLVATLSLGITGFVFIRYSPLPMLTLYLYAAHNYWYKDFITIRAGLASSIFLLAAVLLSRGAKANAIILIIIASSIHVSALLFLIIFPIRAVKLQQKGWIVLLFGALLMGQSGLPLYVIRKMVGIGALPAGVGIYLDWDLFNRSIPIYSPVMIKQLFFATLILICYRTLSQSRFSGLVCDIYLIGCSWLFLTSGFSIIAARGTAMFNTIEPILIASMVFLWNKKLVYAAFLFLYLCVFTLNMIKLPLDQYATFLSEHHYSKPLFEEVD